jgi:thiol:disulfide interchange protein
MAITFTLVSFTCTTAFVATVLVMATKGSYLRPVLGMLTFSTVFAFPFFFLALFPGMLAKLPKSGGWMQKVKSTAGLIELAFVVKFLSVADIGFSPDATPRFLDFTTAIVVWATLAFVTGLYLLGVFRFTEDSPSNGISPIGGLWGIGSLSLAMLMCVGLFSPAQPDNWVWNRLVGFAPPQFEVAVADTRPGASTVVDQYAELRSAQYSLVHDGLAYSLQLGDAVRVAEENNRPLFVDFTGVNCINCRDMEKSVLNRPEVVSILATLPRAQLFLDTVPTIHDSAEKERLLEQNLKLSTELTGGLVMPSYLILAPDGRTVMSRTEGLVSREDFREFLETGIRRFEESQSNAEVTFSQTSKSAH